MLSIFLSRQLLNKQRKIAMFSEMVHSASLVHDDVIDQSDFRRGKPSVNVLWNHKKVRIVFVIKRHISVVSPFESGNSKYCSNFFRNAFVSHMKLVRAIGFKTLV